MDIDIDKERMKKKLAILEKWEAELEGLETEGRKKIEALRDKLVELDIKIGICTKVKRDASEFEDEKTKTDDKILRLKKELDEYTSQNAELMKEIKNQIADYKYFIGRK